MSTLIAVSYSDEATAREALETLTRLQKDELIQLDDIILARHDGDAIKLEQGLNLTTQGAATGAMWGGLLGLIFLVPIAGMVVGAASGAIVGNASDVGIDDSFAKELATSLPAGSAALLMMIRSANSEKVLAEMQEFGGTILHTNLSEEAEERLSAALEDGDSTT